MFVEITDRRGNIIPINTTHIGYFYKKESPVPTCVMQMQGGKVMYGEFQTEAELEEFIETLQAAVSGGLKQVDTQADLPKTGNVGTVYITKDTGQTYYWDKVSKTYVKTGTSGRTGVYSINKPLPQAVGATIILDKSDLTEILKPSVDYSEGSEVIGDNSVHGIITAVNGNQVTVKTVTDLTIDSFRQVATENDLPLQGIENILYFVQDEDEFRIWDTGEGKWVEPFHPIIFKDIPVANAKLNTLYVIDNKIRYTTDNTNWITVSGAELERDITSNVDCGAAPKGTFFKEGMSFTDFAEKILRKDITPTISTSFSNTGNKQVGTSVNSSLFKLTITNLADITVLINKVDFYIDSTLVDSQPFVSGQSVYQFNYTTPITSNVPATITAKAVLTYQTSKTAQGTGKFTFVYPSYTCVTTYATIGDAEANTLQMMATKNIKTAKGYTWNNINVNDERFCYMYPKSFGALTSILDGNGFSQMDSYTRYDVNITDITTGNTEPYYVYLLTDPTTGTGFKQVYA